MELAVKIRRVEEWDAPDLPEWVRSRVKASAYSVQGFCEAAEISRQFYYDLINGKADSISDDTLQRIETILQDSYPREGDRTNE